MALKTWNTSMALNISEIDYQHKQLSGLIRRLHETKNDAGSNDVVNDIVKRLVDYTRYHFATEVKYFDQFGYSETEHHKEEHKYLLQQVDRFRIALDSGSTRLDGSSRALTDELWDFLMNWFINHIQVTDKKYVSLFKTRGLK